MEYLAYIGIIAILVGFGWSGYWLLRQVKWGNPIKSYIKKVVMDYLKELQND